MISVVYSVRLPDQPRKRHPGNRALALARNLAGSRWATRTQLLFCAVALNLNQLSMEGSNPCATIPWLAFQTG